MYWEKEIRFKLTTRRIFSGIIVVMSVLNLAVVGAVIYASSQSTSETHTASMTSIPTQETLIGVFPSNTLAMIPPIPVFTSVITHAPGPTLISTSPPTGTATTVPPAIICVQRSYWPAYRVQKGDILIAIAQATGTTVRELMEANCLPDTRIYAGQILYVPRLPIHTLTSTLTPSFTSTNIPSSTPTDTPSPTLTSTPTNTPIITPTNIPPTFQDPFAFFWICDSADYISFIVAVNNFQDIRAVTVVYKINDGILNEAPMEYYENGYYGFRLTSDQFSTTDTVEYYFWGVDYLGETGKSATYTAKPEPCLVPKVGNSTGSERALNFHLNGLAGR